MKGIITIEYVTAQLVRQDQELEDLRGYVRDLNLVVKVLWTITTILLSALFYGGL